MIRDMNKAAAEGMKIASKHPRRDLDAQDLWHLMDEVRQKHQLTNEVYDAVCNAYYVGLAIGTRTARG